MLTLQRSFIALFAIMLLASLLQAQTTSTPTAAADAAAQEQVGEDVRLVKVATLNSIEANQEFQRNVRIMQMARQQALKIKEELDQTIDPDKKAELQAVLEDAVKQINDNNRKMIENYGFSLNRNYVLVMEKTHIYMQVTEEEAQRIKEEMEKGNVQTQDSEAQTN